ncbi:MAG: hypothetical protein LW629_03185 [Burkholderiales bacterium]|nr:hypothetical protein [Burkholderiales bacterium]
MSKIGECFKVELKTRIKQAAFTVLMLLLALPAVQGCKPAQPTISMQREVADSFMAALSEGNTEAAQELTMNRHGSQEAVVYLTKAVKKRVGEQGIRAFDFKYVSELRAMSNTDTARVVYSQKINNEIPQDNIVVELNYDETKKQWKVSNLILR